MAEYLPETKTKTASLDYRERLDVTFRPRNPGPILIRSTARAEKDPRTNRPNPTSRTIELLKPGSTSPVVTNTNHTGVTSFLETTVSESETPTRRFELSVTYPGDVRLETAEVPVETIRTYLNGALNSIDVHVTSGRQKSYVRFPDPEAETGFPEHQFTVRDYRNRWLGVREKVTDLNDRSVRLLSL